MDVILRRTENSSFFLFFLLFLFIKCIVFIQLLNGYECIKPGIQERGTECRERREWGESYIPKNVAKHSGECPQTFWAMPSNIPGNVKHSNECHQTFRGLQPNLPENVAKHSGEYPQTFSIFQSVLVLELVKCSPPRNISLAKFL